jgi:hypothetical protein
MTPRALLVGKWFIRVWAALAIAFGIGFALFGAVEWDRAIASTGWPTASGTVAESTVVHSTSRRKGRTSSSHTPRVTYRYVVDGREFEASRISFRVNSSSRTAADAVVAKYPTGASVTVHHSPDDPSLACLEPGTDEWQALPLGIGALALLLGLGVGWFVPRKLDARLRALESGSGIPEPRPDRGAAS